MKIWNDFIKPIVVLGVICIVTSALLAVTNSVTAPVIEENAIATANATRANLIASDSFTQIETTVENVTEVYSADNGAGYVITAKAKGYNGDVPVMVAFDLNGEIMGVTFLANDETPGLGQKITADKFENQFVGRKAEAMGLSDIDAISGATISSSAAVNAINNAISAYNEVAGVEVLDLTKLTIDEVHAMVLPDSGELTAYDIPNVDEAEAYKGSSYGMIIYAEAPGFYNKPVTAIVGFDDDGTILGVWFNAENETAGVGDQIASDASFAQQFIGNKDAKSADAIAGATVSSNAAIKAVENAIEYFNAEMEVGS